MKLSVFRKLLKACNDICPNAKISLIDSKENYFNFPDNIITYEDNYNPYEIIPIVKLKGPKYPNGTMTVYKLYDALCKYVKSTDDYDVCIICGDSIYTVDGICYNNDDIVINVDNVTNMYPGLIEKTFPHIKFCGCYQSVVGFPNNISDFSLLKYVTVRLQSVADGDISYIFKVKRICIQSSDLLFHIEVDYGKYKTHDLYLSDRYKYSVKKINNQNQNIVVTLEGEGEW